MPGSPPVPERNTNFTVQSKNPSGSLKHIYRISVFLSLSLGIVFSVSAQTLNTKVLLKHPDAQIRSLADLCLQVEGTGNDSARAALLRPIEAQEHFFTPAEKVMLSLIRYRDKLNADDNDAAFVDIRTAAQQADLILTDDLVRGVAYTELGLYLQMYGVNELATGYLEKGIRILEPADAPDALFTLVPRNRLINAFGFAGEVDSAAVYRDSTIAYVTRLGNAVALTDLYNNKGLYLHSQQRYEEALNTFTTGIALMDTASATGTLLRKVNIEESQAHTLIALGRREEGLENLYEAMAVRFQMGNTGGAMQAWTYLMDYYLEFGEPQKAYTFYQTYVDKFPEMRERRASAHLTYPVVVKVLRANGHQSQANELEKLSNSYRVDFLEHQVERLNKRSNLSAFTRYRNEAFEKEAALKELENAHLRQHLTLRNRTVYGLLIILLLTVLGLWYYFKTRSELLQRQKQTENQMRRILQLENDNLKYNIELKERDLKHIAADNKLRTSIKKDLVRKLRSIDQLPDQKMRKSLFLLIQELDQNLFSEEKLNLIQENIHSLNAAFEDNLKSNVPGITQSEVELCSLIRLGMNNHDIANMLNKANSTIRVYKTRIKDKAGVESVGELEEMLRKL